MLGLTDSRRPSVCKDGLLSVLSSKLFRISSEIFIAALIGYRVLTQTGIKIENTI